MDSGWQQRRALAAALRVAVTLVPVVASVAVGVLANSLLPVPETVPGALLRAGGILAASMTVLVGVDTLARRLLPLTVLLQLSLIFPDQTPSRFKLALKAGSGRRMAKTMSDATAHGLSDEPAEAAEQLVLLATAIGDHDRRTRGHSERVRLYAELIGEGLGLGKEDRAKLQWAALIHDIGKITVPPAILNKKGKPDADEWAILQGHPAAGEAFVEPVAEWLGEWVHAIGGHHEKWDGSGYPRKLVGNEIPRSAAIVAVADSFEVMTAVRSYKKAMTLADARREMTRCAGTHFSPEVVRGFLNLSIGDLRRSMGVLAALAHVPVLGRLTTAASYAPDTVNTAVNLTTSAATAGAGAVAVTAAITVGAPAMASAADAPPPAAPVALVAAPASATVDAPAAHGTFTARPGTAKIGAGVDTGSTTGTAGTASVAADDDEIAQADAPAQHAPSARWLDRSTSAATSEHESIVVVTASPTLTSTSSGADEDTDELAVPSARAGRADDRPTSDGATTAPAEEPAAPQGNGNNGNGGGNADPGPSADADHGNGNAGGNGNGNAGGNGNGNGGGNGNAGGNGHGNGNAEPAPTSDPGPGNGGGNGNGNAGGGNGSAGGNGGGSGNASGGNGGGNGNGNAGGGNGNAGGGSGNAGGGNGGGNGNGHGKDAPT
jgi:hypothetical protein